MNTNFNNFGVTNMDLLHFNEPNITRRLVDCSDFKNIHKDIKGISFFI